MSEEEKQKMKECKKNQIPGMFQVELQQRLNKQ